MFVTWKNVNDTQIFIVSCFLLCVPSFVACINLLFSVRSTRLKSEHIGFSHWKSSLARSECLTNLHFVSVTHCLCLQGRLYQANVGEKYFGMCTLGTKTMYPQFFVNVLQIYILSLHQIVCAHKDINTKPMFQYFLRIAREKYFGMRTLGTKTTL